MDSLINSFNNCTLDNNNNIVKFIEDIDLFNKHQSNILLKLYCNFSNDIYLSNYNKDTNIIEILGAKKKGKRETYNVIIKNNKFTCNCKDFEFRSQKLNIVCKHICFIVCKVSFFYDLEFFKTKILSEKLLDLLLLNLDKYELNSQFKVIDTVNLSDSCAICYEEFSNEVLICCPLCKNNLHKKCMEIWIEKNKTCVYCRNSWENYRII